MDYSRFPAVLAGVGLAIALYAVVSLVLMPPLPPDETIVVVANLVTMTGFALTTVGVGWWLQRGDLPVERYPRIAGWSLAGFTLFTGFFGIVAAGTSEQLAEQVGIVAWAVATGLGGGALVGTFEARAIERATAAEEVRVRNEELQRQNERLEEFAGIVAHDLRNPLTIANAYVDDVRRDSDDDRLDGALAALERLDETIDETLTLARAGRVVDDVAAVDLAEVTEECWAGVQTGEATLEVTVEGGFSVGADRERLQRLLENLFRNSVEHGDEDVTVTLGSLPDGFYVADDGPGIPEEDRPHVTEAGFSTREGGTGFGLAIVEQIAEAHGWALTVTESESGGARFEVRDVGSRTGVAAEPGGEAAEAAR